MLCDNTSYRELSSIQRDLTRPKYILLIFLLIFIIYHYVHVTVVACGSRGEHWVTWTCY